MEKGDKTKIKYQVSNSRCDLLGEFSTRKEAKACKLEWEEEYLESPYTCDLDVYVEEIEESECKEGGNKNGI